MKCKIALATGTAVGVLMVTGAALAGSNNKAYLDQATVGTIGNIATVTQSGSSNQAGSTGLHMKQRGLANELTILQGGDSNSLGLTPHGVQQNQSNAALAIGRNMATLKQHTSGNTIGRVIQTNAYNLDTPATNSLVVNQGAVTDSSGNASNNNIHTIFQTYYFGGGANTITVSQSGGAGDANSIYGIAQGGHSSTVNVGQSGQSNYINLVSQGTSTGLYPAGSANNSATVMQTGTLNAVTTLQQRSSNNAAAVGNLATVIQNGTGNILTSFWQDSIGGTAMNTASLSFLGDGNGNDVLSGPAAVANAPSSSLVQLGSGNAVTLDVTGNLTQFGFYQQGLANTVGTVSISGNSNELGVTQTGTNTLGISTIEGDFNRIGVSQDGTNIATVDVLGTGSNANDVSVSQDGLSNDAAVSITGSSNLITVTQGLDAGVGDNDADLTVAGSLNVLNLDQKGTNTATVNIDGSSNNAVGSLFNNAFFGTTPATLGLDPGDLVQLGSNSLLLDYGQTTPGADSNLFAVRQDGAGNSLTGTVDGSNNQALVAQIGSTNTAVFTQSGGNNFVKVQQ